MVWKDLPTPPCPGMQTSSSFPCSLCCFDSHLAGCATVLDIPGTRKACENCRGSRRLAWGVRGKERNSIDYRLQEPLAYACARPLVGERGGGREGGKELAPSVYRWEILDGVASPSNGYKAAGLGCDCDGFDSKEPLFPPQLPCGYQHLLEWIGPPFSCCILDQPSFSTWAEQRVFLG